MRLSPAVAAALLCSSAALAQPAPSAPSAPATPPAAPAAPGAGSAATAPAQPDPVVAIVGDHKLHLSDVAEAAQSLPDELRSMPPQVLYPMLLDQMVDREALVIQAKKEGLDKLPQVQHAMEAADDTVLQNALLSRDIGPSVTDAAIHAKYDQEYANKPGEEEVHAAHILVDNEDQAKKIIDQLNHGGDFAALAKQYSKDPAAQNGGDLGWFKKGDMVPQFADAAFALKPGQITQTPVKTQFGWHVIKLEDRRQAPPPSFDQAKDEIRQQLIQAGVRKALDQARQGLPIQKFNMDGTPMAPSAAATPNPATTPTTDLPPASTPGAAPGTPKP